MSKKIPDNIICILEEATISKDEKSLTINRELDRKEYLLVDEVLQSIRGKWNKSVKAHIFPFDPTGPLEDVLEKKEMDPKNATAYFPTPLSAVELMFNMVDGLMIEYATKEHPRKILEPSAGIGGIADYIMSKSEHVQVDTVEIHPPNQKVLKSKGYEPYCMDFVDFPVPQEDEKYDFVFMNPPFSLKGDKKAYMTHIKHAFKMLRPAGELVAIVPSGWCTNQSKADEEFRNLIATYGGHVEALEAGTFKESGTMVETKVITLGVHDWKKEPFNGFDSRHIWEFMLYATHEAELGEVYYALMEKPGVTKDELEAFAKDVLISCAKRDIFLSSGHMDKYIEELWGNTIEGERLYHVEYLKRCVAKIHALKFSMAYISIKDMNWTMHADSSFMSASLIASWKRDCKEYGVDMQASTNKLSLEKQTAILQDGGDLFSLMSA